MSNGEKEYSIKHVEELSGRKFTNENGKATFISSLIFLVVGCAVRMLEAQEGKKGFSKSCTIPQSSSLALSYIASIRFNV